MSEFTPASKRKLLTICMISVFTITIAIVLEQKMKKVTAEDETLVVNGVINQHHLRWHFNK